MSRLGFLALAVVLSLICSGCPKRAGAPGAVPPGGEITEKGIPEESSLERHRKGLPPGEAAGPLTDIHFTFDSYDLSTEAREALQSNAQWLKTNPQAKIEIEGHCDERGTVEYNLALGAKRATAAKEYFVALGISAERLSTISYGEELPLCRENHEECWWRNRRAHFVTLSQ